MTWKQVFTSTIGQKFVMGLTGLFLISFLVVHVGLNATIWADDNGRMFNDAAEWMGGTVVTRILEVGLFIGIFLHIIQGYMLTAYNNSRRGTGYRVNKGYGSKWYSRTMGLLGTLILLFLIMHIWHFWWPSRITHDLPIDAYKDGRHNLYARMISVFQEPVVVILYVLACISLAYHLAHGFKASFRTFGVSNSRYYSLIKACGYAFAIIVPLAFAMMPVSMYLGWIK
ncbi:MAG: succinate dehydrogenase cytochrome b subunit [Chitinophagaceae bacterium]|jgi:succinate dehydrogenase / fumarate reductase cytochrome b subunit|nr:succinate dehydrogenase cytochrome b subunit [Chitinophagaceae bacterium]